MTISLSVIVPTIGRLSLGNVLRDIVLELEPGDEVIIVGDGPQPNAKTLCERLERVRYLETEKTRCFGNAQRNHALNVARGTHVMFLDDDDRMVVGAVKNIKKTISLRPDAPHLFKIYHLNGIIWKERRVARCNVGGQMAVFPNVQDRLGKWSNRYEGDLDFISSTIEKYPNKHDDIVWNSTVINVHGTSGMLAAHPDWSVRKYK